MTHSAPRTAVSSRPLVVDLDGTAIVTDLLYESILALVRFRPWCCLWLPWWLFRGKAAFKRKLAEVIVPDFSSIPVNKPFLDWVAAEKSKGRLVVLSSASDQILVDGFVLHHPIFDAAHGSDGVTNNGSANKRVRLETEFGVGGFDYAGNARADLNVWCAAGHVHMVEVSSRLVRRVQRLGKPMTTHSVKNFPIQPFFRALRPQQWLKNLLIFVPLITAHVLEPGLWGGALLAFLAMSLIASGVYIANDLIDLAADREHPRKRFRPFASGRLPLPVGMVASPVLMFSGLLIAASVSIDLFWVLSLYLALTTIYSFWLKRLALIDVFLLASLYTLRLVAGGIAVAVILSEWLLAFSIFVFLSLAILKRYGELTDAARNARAPTPGRGYESEDLDLLLSLAVASAFSAVLIFSLYISSETVVALYKAPVFLWGSSLVILLWLCHMLLVTHRGHMHDDPLVFAVTDRLSLGLGVLFAAFFLLAV